MLMADVVQDHVDFTGVSGIYDLRIPVIILHIQAQHTQGCFSPVRCVNTHPGAC